jgi:glutamate carboxypeptidase
VVVHGRAAHAGNAFREGAHALWALAKYIDAIHALNDSMDGCVVNMGTASAGTLENIVPDRAEGCLVFRFAVHEQGEAILQFLKVEAVERIEAQMPGVRFEVEGGITHPPLTRSAASADLAHLYGECASAEGLGTEESPELGGASDANNASALGLATIDGLGPRGAGFHTRDEYIEAASLTAKAAALIRFLLRSCPPR